MQRVVEAGGNRPWWRLPGVPGWCRLPRLQLRWRHGMGEWWCWWFQIWFVQYIYIYNIIYNILYILYYINKYIYICTYAYVICIHMHDICICTVRNRTYIHEVPWFLNYFHWFVRWDPPSSQAATLPAADGSDGRPLVAASAAVGQAEGPWEAPNHTDSPTKISLQ